MNKILMNKINNFQDKDNMEMFIKFIINKIKQIMQLNIKY